MVKFENREIWADLENRSKVVHSENFPIWRPASGHRDHVTSHVTHWGQWKYASRSWHAVGNHRRQLKLMYRSKISGRGPKHCCGSKFQCRPRPDYLSQCWSRSLTPYHISSPGSNVLTHWGWVTHICVSKLSIIGSGSVGSRQYRWLLPCDPPATFPMILKKLHMIILEIIDWLLYQNHWLIKFLGTTLFRQWLVTWPVPSHYLNKCWNIINWTLRNKLQWNLNQKSYIFTQENALGNVIWKMAAILS